MKLKTIIAISASIFLVGANLFVISAKQGSVNCKNLLSKTFSFNHFAYADDPGFISGSYPTGKAYPDGIADCSSMEIEEYSIDVKINSSAGQNLKKYIDAGGSLKTNGLRFIDGNVSINGGNNSNNSSNNSSDMRIVGKIIVNVKTARPQYVYCDYRDQIKCDDNPDPCSELKQDYLNKAKATFGI